MILFNLYEVKNLCGEFFFNTVSAMRNKKYLYAIVKQDFIDN